MKVHNAITCEDIRTEDNGKFILIGVFQENIVVPTIPFTLGLAWWLQFYCNREGTISFEFEARRNSHAVATATFDGNVLDHTKPVTTAIPRVPIKIESEGIISLHIREKGTRWKKITEVVVRRREV